MSAEKMMKREATQPETQGSRHRTISPSCDVYEDGKEFLIVAEMPGVADNSVDLRLDRTRLSIEAIRPSMDPEGDNAIQTRYVRAFEVPDTIDAASISAELRHGVLTVHLPKAPQARVRQIHVTAG